MRFKRRTFYGFVIKPFLFTILITSFSPDTVQTGVDRLKRIERAGFHVQFRDLVVSYPVMGVFILPGEDMPVQAWDSGRSLCFKIEVEAGVVTETGPNQWVWRVPDEPGLYPIRVIDSQNKESIILNVFVMVPLQQACNGCINGYTIGNYPDTPYRNLPEYRPPAGLVEVTKQNQDAWVSPHFQLKQFLCKGCTSYPQYIAIQEPLLFKLEGILHSLQQKGYGCQTLSILSGYRTPHYNRSIGNGKYSRHIYGAAADIFIDVDPKDGQMDDLNMDGRVDVKDAKVLFDHIDGLSDDPTFRAFVGGLGIYETTATHGPFVHVDVRGYRARWGAGSG
jgi:hypothetical protein